MDRSRLAVIIRVHPTTINTRVPISQSAPDCTGLVPWTSINNAGGRAATGEALSLMDDVGCCETEGTQGQGPLPLHLFIEIYITKSKQYFKVNLYSSISTLGKTTESGKILHIAYSVICHTYKTAPGQKTSNTVTLFLVSFCDYKKKKNLTNDDKDCPELWTHLAQASYLLTTPSVLPSQP